MSFDPEQITFFAKTDARGQQVPFGIKAKDRTRHVYVIGKTGMGKSTLLENMAVQDIKNGNGLAFIDPHGATAETLLEYIPEERIKDVLYFAPFDTAHPISFNVMEDVGPDKRHLVVSGLMSVFKKIWVDAWSARMEYILSNTLLALLEYPDSTLLGVNRMLSDKHYRKKVIDNITDPAVKSFWVDEFLNYNERYMQEAGDAIKNKIGQFTSNPLIRNIVGQPHSSFDLREIMDGKKILIANLSKGLVGESNANLLGSMLTTRLYLAAMSRADLSSEQLKAMPNFYFYVDEFQSFANATFADILSEARKYKLNLTIAHQYIEQMEEEVRNAVFGNVGTIISFRVGPFDAEVLETVFTPKFLAADIVNLGFAQIYLSLMIDGIGSAPFSATKLPPIAPPHISYKDIAIAESRRHFAGERSVVEGAINAWHAEVFAEERLRGGDKPTSTGLRTKGSGSTSATGRAVSGGSTQRENHSGERESSAPAAPLSPKPAFKAARDAASKNRDRRLPEGVREMGDSMSAPSQVHEWSAPAGKSESGSPRERSRTKDLDELRNVLKTIVNKEAAPPRAALPTIEAPSEREKRSDLKAALAAAIGQPLPEAAVARTPDTDTPALQDRGQATRLPVSEDRSESAAPPQTSEAGRSAELHAPVKQSDDPLAAKRLERMMRVTGSDRNPLR